MLPITAGIQMEMKMVYGVIPLILKSDGNTVICPDVITTVRYPELDGNIMDYNIPL